MKAFNRTFAGHAWLCAIVAVVACSLVASSSPRGRRSRPTSRRRSRRPTRSTKTLRKARTPTTSRRSPRWTPNIFGIALVTVDGKVYTIGDIKSEVSIQSISKVFTMAKVMDEQGAEGDRGQHGRRRHRPGVQLHRRGRAVQGRRDERDGQSRRHHGDQHGRRAASRDEIWSKILGWYSDFAGRQLGVNQEVYKSEADTNQRNQAISMLMYAYGHIKDNPLQAHATSTRSSARSASTRKTSP